MNKKCVVCGASLNRANRGDNPGARVQMKYCSDACEKQYHNARYYRAHKPTIIARILARRKKGKP